MYISLFLLFTFSLSAQSRIEVFFDFNIDFPNEASMKLLEKWMADHQKAEIQQLSGYCDSIDNNSYNNDLSLRRIHSVMKLLRANNIAFSPAIVLNPLGENFKQSKIQSENRKVTIIYKEQEKPLTVEKKPEKTLSEEVQQAKPGDIIRLRNINFFNNSDAVVPKSKPLLAELLCILQDHPNLKIEIQGHVCCELVKDTRDISTARAKAIYVYLIRNKISRERLAFKGYGNSKPIHPIPEKSDEEENENRRVEILIVEN